VTAVRTPSHLDAFLRARAVPVAVPGDRFGSPAPTAVDRMYTIDGNYWVIWMCEPPGWEVPYHVIRDEWKWNGDATERRIHEWGAWRHEPPAARP
jgi:hypothetical protein